MTGWATEALVASALLMVVVLLVRIPVRRLFGPQLAYALWSLPLLRLMMPPLPASWREQAALPIAQAREVMTVLVGPDIAPGTIPLVTEPAVTLPWGGIVLAAWLLGAALFFGLHFVRHRRFCRRLLAEARMLDRIDGVRVIETPAASGPLAFGMARRFVAFPHDFAERYDADERELALAHELGHHARGDLIANWVALAVLAFHWFNPLAWHAFRVFRCDQELANDARVLAGRSRMERHIYACAIVKAAHGGAISAACHLHTITDLKGRLRMLSNTRLSRTRLVTGAAAVIGAVAGGLLVTASGTQAAAALTKRVESATGVQLVAPAAPPMPAAPPTPPAKVPVPTAPAAATRSVERVVIVKDGKTARYDGDAAAAYIAANPVPLRPIPPLPPMPPRAPAAPTHHSVTTFHSNGHATIVDSGDCEPITGAPAITRTEKDGRHITIICHNRMRAMARSAVRQAEIGARQAKVAAARADLMARGGIQQALAGIRLARRSIENERNLTDDQRRDALAGLDDALKELRSAKAD